MIRMQYINEIKNKIKPWKAPGTNLDNDLNFSLNIEFFNARLFFRKEVEV